jgi:hypothetical protein
MTMSHLPSYLRRSAMFLLALQMNQKTLKRLQFLGQYAGLPKNQNQFHWMNHL